MVSSNLNNNALGNSVVGSTVCHKQSTLPMKKIALRDLQNDNRSFMPNYPENVFLGRPVVDPIKVLGTKILNPELPRSSSCHQFTSISSASDQLMHGGGARKLDSALGKRRVQGVTEQNTYSLNFKRYCSQKQQDLPKDRTKKQEHETSAFAPMPLASPVKFSPGKPPVPMFLGKPSNGLPAAHSRHLRFTPESLVPHLVGSEKNHDEQRTEGFLHLQNLLKQFDDSDQREYIQSSASSFIAI
ncbi:hypothetical protein ACE6H2_016082 [Prunus campanulata]